MISKDLDRACVTTMSSEPYPLLDEFLQALRCNDPASVDNLVDTIRRDSTTQEIARCLLENISMLPESSTKVEEIFEVASKLGVDQSRTEEDAPQDVNKKAVPSILPQQDLARLTYAARRKSRCRDHEHVEEWIACPRCKVCFEALNEFATCGNSENKLCCLDELSLRDEHVMIIGIEQGWDKCRGRTGFDSSWERYAKFDSELEVQRIVKPIDRLAYFFVRYWWRFRLLPFEKRSPSMLPPFLRPIPIQLNYSHDAVIDICPFPMIRHKLITDKEKYKTDYFWQPYLTSLRFFWPFDFADAITQDSRTGLCQFSLAFRQGLCQAQSWSLAGEFFDIFPEFRDDAPIHRPDRIANPVLISLHRSKQQSILLHSKQCSVVATVSEVTSDDVDSDLTQGRKKRHKKAISQSSGGKHISLQPLTVSTARKQISDMDEEFWRASGCR